MKNTLASLINLVTLLVGITIGVMIAPHLEKPAQAYSAAPQGGQTAPTSAIAPNAPEQVQPSMTIGTVGIYLILSHHVQSDELVVNGLDMLKLTQGELNLLARIPGVSPMEIQRIISEARDTHLYQVATPKQPQQATPPAK